MKRVILSFTAILTFANASSLLDKSTFKNLVKSNNPDYCLTKNKYYYLDYKNDFGEYVKTKFPAAKAVLGMKEHLDKIEFNRDVDRIEFLAFLIKNNSFFTEFFNPDDKDDEIFKNSVFLSSYLRYSGNLGYISTHWYNIGKFAN